MSIARLTVRPFVRPLTVEGHSSSNLVRGLSSFSAPQNDQQLQWSVLKTDHFQRSLPRLPVPKLKDTCDRYLESVRALISDSKATAHTESIVRKFEAGTGAELNQQLIQQDKSNRHTSYICQPWFDMYLKSRTPLVLNYNPFMGWKDDARPAYNEQSVRTVNLLVSALRFRRSLADKRLEPEVFHLKPSKSDTSLWRTTMRATPSSIAWYVSALAFQAYALDMSQFDRLFGSTRLPRVHQDELITKTDSKHVILLRHGQFYRLQVLDDTNNIRDPKLLCCAIRDLLRRPPPSAEQNQQSICALSADDRNKAATARLALESIGDNPTALNEIDTALLLICLDDSPSDAQAGDRKTLAHSALHGNIQSTADKPVNRWFDKSLSLLITPQGQAAVNFEHSWGDGVAVLRFFNDVYDDSIGRPALNADTIDLGSIDSIGSAGTSLLTPITIQTDAATRDLLRQSQQSWFDRTSRLDLQYILYGDLNRELFKRARLSPDSMFQLAFQLAHVRAFGKRVATYEACSTSAFRHGRTETVRPVTQATVAACEAILSKRSGDHAALKPLLSACSDRHSLLTKQAAMGQGFDRHLFAMRNLWEKKHGPGAALPDLYTDPVWEQMNRFVLSTSTLYGEAFSGGGFGPVLPDGFGVAYGYVDGQLGVLCSSYKGLQDGDQFIQAVQKSLNDIRDIIV